MPDNINLYWIYPDDLYDLIRNEDVENCKISEWEYARIRIRNKCKIEEGLIEITKTNLILLILNKEVYIYDKDEIGLLKVLL